MTASDLPPHRTRRISLSKTQLRTELGAELLSICQSVTADGRMEAEEAELLREWLEDAKAADLPAATYLEEVVQRVLEDGVVTPEEQREVYRAVETVLPPEVRREAVAARREVEATERAEKRAEAEAEKEREREERYRNRPIGNANFMVAGVRYEGRPEIIRRHAIPGDNAFLIRQPNNRYSRNAIAVALENGQQAGFVPEEDAGFLAPLMDKGAKVEATITKILTAGRSPIPVVQAYLYGSDSTVDVPKAPRLSAAAAVSNSQAASAVEDGRTKRTWSGLVWALVAIMVLLLVLALVGQ